MRIERNGLVFWAPDDATELVNGQWTPISAGALVPWDLHEARQAVADAQAALDALPDVPDQELLGWAKANHPSQDQRRILAINLENARKRLAEVENGYHHN